MKVLYYSPRCSKCQNLIQSHNLNGIKQINIDTTQFPQYIKSVPTLVVDKNMYVGNNAIQYLQENMNIDAYEFGLNTGGFSFIDDDNCYYTEQRNYSEIN